MPILENASQLDNLFNDDHLVKKYRRKLAVLVAEQVLCAPELRKELLPTIVSQKAQLHTQIKGRKIQLLKAIDYVKSI